MTTNNKFDKDVIQKILSNHVAIIKYKKLGSDDIHEMLCTLKPEYLPQKNVVNEQQTEKDSLTRKENPNILAVWALERNDWRSFRINSVEDIIVKSNGTKT